MKLLGRILFHVILMNLIVLSFFAAVHLAATLEVPIHHFTIGLTTVAGIFIACVFHYMDHKWGDH